MSKTLSPKQKKCTDFLDDVGFRFNEGFGFGRCWVARRGAQVSGEEKYTKNRRCAQTRHFSVLITELSFRNVGVQYTTPVWGMDSFHLHLLSRFRLWRWVHARTRREGNPVWRQAGRGRASLPGSLEGGGEGLFAWRVAAPCFAAFRPCLCPGGLASPALPCRASHHHPHSLLRPRHCSQRYSRLSPAALAA